MLSVHLFGPFILEYDGQPVLIPSRAGRSLLAYLLFHAHVEHSRTRLCNLFWPDLDESTARRRLSYVLWEIGRSPGTESLILRNADTLGVDRAQVQAIDVHAFEEALNHAVRQTSDQDALPFLRQAVALYTAPLLADDYSDWVIAEQERLRERYIQAAQRLIAGHKSNQDYEQALLAALALIQVDPLHEGAYQEAIWLYHRLGRLHDAQQRYDELCTVLHEEFGAVPAPETTALMETGPPSIDERAPDTPPFAQDIPLIGRKMERRVLIEHLERAMRGQGGVLFVVGEPGVGKSRLLDALAE
ncbi:MAG: BTAD domain-containing putative transcriptional regulator, partial [Caldilineaceae bacterium]